MNNMITSSHSPSVEARIDDRPLPAQRIMDVFESLGLRNTRPRRAIAERLAELAREGVEFSVQDFWTDLQTRDPQIGRATVFRAVDVLVENGVLDRVPVAGGTYRYRICGTTHHHHIRCRQCQRVVETDACIPQEILAAVADATNFAIEGHSLELFGRCPDCRPE